MKNNLNKFKLIRQKVTKDGLPHIELEFESKPTHRMHALIGHSELINEVLDLVNCAVLFPQLCEGLKLEGSDGQIVTAADFGSVISISTSVCRRPVFGSMYNANLRRPTNYQEIHFDHAEDKFKLKYCFTHFLNDDSIIGSKKDKWLEILKTIYSSKCLTKCSKYSTPFGNPDNFVKYLAGLNKFKFIEENLHMFDYVNNDLRLALTILLGLLVKIEPNSLITINNFERYLEEPNLLAAYQKCLLNLLNETQSMLIVSTFSPIILQNICSSNIHDIRGVGGATAVYHPKNQTFGESISSIVEENLEYNVGESFFYKKLENLFDQLGTREKVISELNEDVGFLGRCMLLTLQSNKDKS